ncbi:MAG: energy transducer TonB [Spirochaetaceae bacterium]
MRRVTAQAENRRFLLSLAAALLAHLALGLLLSTLPERSSPEEREYELLRVTLSPGREVAETESSTAGGEGRPERAVESEREEAQPESADAEPERAQKSADAAETESSSDPEPQKAQKQAGETRKVNTPELVEVPPQAAASPATERLLSGLPEIEEPAEVLPPSELGLRGDGTGEGEADDASGTAEEGLPTLEPTRYVTPEYPDSARRAGWAGTVVLELSIGRRGRVDEFELVESSGHEILDEAALRAARLWRFPRAEAGEKSIHRFEFRLEQQ